VKRAALLAAALLLGLAAPDESARLQGVADAASATARTQLHARFGIVVWDVTTGARASVDGDAGFPLASAFKLPLALAVLERVDAGRLTLDERVRVLPADVVTYASAVAEEYAKGRRTFSVEDLMTRMVRDSDNTAADTLYRLVGGARTVNAALRGAGIRGFAIRTDEAGLHRDFAAGRTFARGGDNAGTPDAYATLLKELAASTRPRTGPLRPSSADLLYDAMSASQTGIGRLRAGLPAKTVLLHKTGTSGRFADGSVDATNDAGLALLAGGTRKVIVVAFLNGGRGTDEQNDAAIADLARAVVRAIR